MPGVLASTTNVGAREALTCHVVSPGICQLSTQRQRDACGSRLGPRVTRKWGRRPVVTSTAANGTSTVPIMTSWMEQTYVNVPAAPNVNRKL